MVLGGEDGVFGGAGLRYYRCGACTSHNRNFGKLLSKIGEQFIAGLLRACSKETSVSKCLYEASQPEIATE